jgi:hypothetical protein
LAFGFLAGMGIVGVGPGMLRLVDRSIRMVAVRWKVR